MNIDIQISKPQWSPVMKTGNTPRRVQGPLRKVECLNGARS